MKRLIHKYEKHNKKQKLEECKTLYINDPNAIIQTPCGKFLIGVEHHGIYKYCLKTKQKFRIAGSVEQNGYQDGTRDESKFYYPLFLTLSKDLKTLFVADTLNCLIRAICVETGDTTTVTGKVDVPIHIDGPKERACFQLPVNLKLSPDGDTLYVADSFKYRSICISTGQVRTIVTFKNCIYDFIFSPDGKHIYICQTQVLKYNLETGKSEIILECQNFVACELSKDGQLLFISNKKNKNIIIVNLVTNQIIDKITTSFEPSKITSCINAKQLYVCDIKHNRVQVFNISKYCTNFKTFIQLQLSKHSFLPRQVIKILIT
jgi:DNA-binding beta-propeller fold protein YncE